MHPAKDNDNHLWATEDNDNHLCEFEYSFSFLFTNSDCQKSPVAFISVFLWSSTTLAGTWRCQISETGEGT
jgi:hypothetical protein